jgi:aminopeptidase-like protein
LHSLPEQPDAVPYRTSYYAESWGFCLSHRQLESLADGEYDVCVDATIAPGHLTYGECVLPGEIEDEILVSTHCCHPSMANDNLSGMVVATHLARHLAGVRRRHTFRFLFIPGTIGSITWLATHEEQAQRIRHGLVLACLGDRGALTYKRSRRGDTTIDRATLQVLREADDAYEAVDFAPYGYDERQYCSPAFDLAVGCLTRTSHGRFREYHTSADNLSFVHAESLQDSLETVARIVEVLEGDAAYVNLNPHCEPQLGRRGLYRPTGGAELPGFELALLWVLNFSDGRFALLDIAERANLPFRVIRAAATALESAALLRPV